MQITLGLVLPPDEMSIAVVRRICRHALREVGVDVECGYNIELALSEACTNALKHAGLDQEYEVRLSMDADRCTISVLDTGQGFDAGSSDAPGSHPMAEAGRGIELMRALVDRVTFENKPDAGTVVRLEKDLALRDDSLAGALRQGRAQAELQQAVTARDEG